MVIELGQFDINYRPCTTIKGQALTDFVTEFTYFDTTEVDGTIGNVKAVKGVETEKDERLRLRVKTTLTTRNNGSSTWTVPLTRTNQERA